MIKSQTNILHKFIDAIDSEAKLWRMQKNAHSVNANVLNISSSVSNEFDAPLVQYAEKISNKMKEDILSRSENVSRLLDETAIKRKAGHVVMASPMVFTISQGLLWPFLVTVPIGWYMGREHRNFVVQDYRLITMDDIVGNYGEMSSTFEGVEVVTRFSSKRHDWKNNPVDNINEQGEFDYVVPHITHDAIRNMCPNVYITSSDVRSYYRFAYYASREEGNYTHKKFIYSNHDKITIRSNSIGIKLRYVLTEKYWKKYNLGRKFLKGFRKSGEWRWRDHERATQFINLPHDGKIIHSEKTEGIITSGRVIMKNVRLNHVNLVCHSAFYDLTHISVHGFLIPLSEFSWSEFGKFRLSILRAANLDLVDLCFTFNPDKYVSYYKNFDVLPNHDNKENNPSLSSLLSMNRNKEVDDKARIIYEHTGLPLARMHEFQILKVDDLKLTKLDQIKETNKNDQNSERRSGRSNSLLLRLLKKGK